MTGSGWRISWRTNGTTRPAPTTRANHGHGLPGPTKRTSISPAMTASNNPHSSAAPGRSRRCEPVGGVSGTPNQMTTKHAVIATAGMASRPVMPITGWRAPDVSAPAMTPTSSARTSTAAAVRVRELSPFVRR